MNNFKILLGEPIIIAQDKKITYPNKPGDGEYQFPSFFKTAEGYIHVNFSLNNDAVSDYGKSGADYISCDSGKTWVKHEKDVGYTSGILLSDGSVVRANWPAPFKKDENKIPKEADGISARGIKLYSIKHFSKEENALIIERKKPNENWVKEYKFVDLPSNIARGLYEGDFFPYFTAESFKKAPNGDLWITAYIPYLNCYNGDSKFLPTFFVSNDNGKTFKYVSTIEYNPDEKTDPLYKDRLGFLEPHISFLPNGAIICLIRTECGSGYGNSYVCYSYDYGKTWTKPVYFDDCSVRPRLLTLKCGVTLATFGRPGAYLRATNDPEGKVWQDKIEIVSKLPVGVCNTCANSDLIDLSDNSALIVYSHFNYMGEDGEKHKTILCRKIEVVGI